MSNLVSSIVQRRIVGSPTKKTVLMYMADRASDDGTGVWTSKAHIAADTELSKRAVQNVFVELEGAGIIRQVGTRSCKHGFTFEYLIDIDAVKLMPSTRSETGAGDSPVQDVHPNGCRTFTPTGAGRSPKPSLEPPLEPSTDARDEPSLFSEATAPKIKPSYRFEDFWSVYPKKIAKQDALIAWQKQIKAGHDPEMMIDAAARYGQTDNVARGFIMNAQGWLNGKRWEDENLPQPVKPMTLEERARRLGPQWGEVER